MKAGQNRARTAGLITLAIILAGGLLWMVFGRSSPNVVLITLDTTRADRLGVYGYKTAETPSMDALAAESVLYQRCYSAVPITLASHSMMMTGLYPPRHGVRVNPPSALGEEAQTLAEVLSENGYQTAAFVGAFVLDAQFGLAQGFDVYDDETTSGDEKRPYAFAERNAEQVTDAALAWWTAKSSEPAFLWVHYFDPHAPYEAPGSDPAFAFRHPYDMEITYTDTQLGRLFEAIRENGEETIIILTADHGEALSEHGEPTHGLFVYDATLHVPLLVRFPGGGGAGRRVKTPVSLVDLMPSVLDWLGLEAPAGLDGRPLPAGEEPEPRPLYFENRLVSVQFGWSPLSGIREDTWKYIRAPRPELYDLSEDAHEEKNLHSSGGENLSRLERLHTQTLEGFRRQGSVAAKNVKITAEALAKLRGLGYLAGESGDEPEGGRDPKDMVGVFMGVQIAISRLTQKKEEEAADALMEIVSSTDPTNGRAIEILASLAPKPLPVRPRIIQTLQEAVKRPIEATALRLALEGIAVGLVQEAKYGDAIEILKHLQGNNADEPRIQAHLGDAYAGLGDREKATAAYRQALAGLHEGEERPKWAEALEERLSKLNDGSQN